MAIRYIYIFLFSIQTLLSNAQLDSNYVVSYTDRLVISSYQSYRFFQIPINQTYFANTDSISKMDFIAQGSNSTGIGLDWDKISFSIGWRTIGYEAQEAKKGITKTKNFAFSLNAKKWRIESSYRDYKGFYDRNTPKFDTSFTETTPYFQNPELRTREFRLKGIYFRNKKNKFSYASAYANTQRQLKSAGTWIWVSNIYRSQFASPTGIINTMIADSLYSHFYDISKINMTGISISPGFSYNLVLFKRLFANLTLDWGIGLQIRTISQQFTSAPFTDFKISATNAGARGSMGYNGDRFFIFIFFIGDYTIVEIDKIRFEQRLAAGGLKLGYRFKFKENKITKAIKNNKFYKML